MRWTSRYVEINGHRTFRPAVGLVMTHEGAAGYGAGSDCNNNFWLGYGIISFFKSCLHVLRHGAGHDNPVSVARGGYVLNAETAEIPAYSVEYIYV